MTKYINSTNSNYYVRINNNGENRFIAFLISNDICTKKKYFASVSNAEKWANKVLFN
jgi:hypothetical protein